MQSSSVSFERVCICVNWEKLLCNTVNHLKSVISFLCIVEIHRQNKPEKIFELQFPGLLVYQTASVTVTPTAAATSTSSTL